MTPARARRLPAPFARSTGRHAASPTRRPVRRGAAVAATLAASAAVLTAAPGVASASVSANLPTTLHFGPSTETVRTGSELHLAVHLFAGNHNLANEDVVIYYAAPGGKWMFWHHVVTNSAGEASLPYTADSTLEFTARFWGDSVYASSASPTYRYTAYSPQHASSATLGQEIVQEAAAQAGKPYQYGAAGPDSFDCSGLTMYVAGHFGIGLPHNAAEQYNDTQHVPQSDAQPGDLLFFYDSSGIYHVGIYAGNGQVWHAPHSGTVVQRDAIWTSAYLVGRLS